MRHNKGFNHLGRKSGHRKAMLANMASSLILHKRITTTEPKAKALRRYVEPLITKCKEDTTHSRRIVFSYLKQKEAVTELFRVIAPAVADRPGGYTRILKIGFRPGDAADMAIIELVDFNEAALASAEKKDAKKATRRRSTKKATAPEAEVKETAKKKSVKEKLPTEEPVKAEETPATEETQVVEETPVAEVTPEETPVEETSTEAPVEEVAAEETPAPVEEEKKEE